VIAVRLKFIQRHKGRDGKVRLYFRHPTLPRQKLPDADSPEFWAAYQAALGQIKPPDPPKRERGKGTFARLCDDWMRTAAYLSLRGPTQRTYSNIIIRMRKEPFADSQLSNFEAKHIRGILKGFSSRPAMANRWLSILGILFRYAVEEEMIPADPTMGIRRMKEKAQGSRTWTEDEIAQYEAHWPVGTRARMAFALMLYTGQRRSDVVRMGQGSINEGLISVVQQKTGTHLLIPIHPSLAEVIALAPEDHKTWLGNTLQGVASAASLGNQFREWANAAGVASDISGHGLRKAAARRLAEAGCTTHQIAAITGHKTLSEVERYTRAVDQRKLAQEAMERMAAVKRNAKFYKDARKSPDFCGPDRDVEVRAGIEPTYADLQSAT